MSKACLNRSAVKQSRFPVFLFGTFFLTLLLMSGIHTGLIVGLNTWEVKWQYICGKCSGKRIGIHSRASGITSGRRMSMDQEQRRNNEFVAYEYKDITVEGDQVSMFLDCYENFGWVIDDRNHPQEYSDVTGTRHQTTIHLKRNRKIINKMELTRLQRHFEACIKEITALEKAKTQMATVWALVTAVVGTVFMGGSTFAVVHEPPLIWQCVLLAIPGFIGWIIPYFLYRKIREKNVQKLQPLIEAKYEEIYEICEKGHGLL